MGIMLRHTVGLQVVFEDRGGGQYARNDPKSQIGQHDRIGTDAVGPDRLEGELSCAGRIVGQRIDARILQDLIFPGMGFRIGHINWPGPTFEGMQMFGRLTMQRSFAAGQKDQGKQQDACTQYAHFSKTFNEERH